MLLHLLRRYEFGKVTADGRRDVMVSGRAPSATLTGLALSTAGVYVCAVDTDGAKVSRNRYKGGGSAQSQVGAYVLCFCITTVALHVAEEQQEN